MDFSGFGSVDPRMEQVPFDLRNESIRREYLKNHKEWFLRNHENAIGDFEEAVETLYPSRTDASGQMTLFESKGNYKAQQSAAVKADKPSD